MNARNTIIVIIAVIIIAIVAGLLPTMLDDDTDRDYTIDLANVYVDVDSNGLVHVKEDYTYTFNGEYNGVYRTIPLSMNQYLENLTVTTDGAYNTVNITHGDIGNYHAKVYLYSDAAKTQKIKDTTVVVHYNYDYVNVTKLYNDVGELQFKVWGNDWDRSPKEFNAYVTFPSSNGVEYWINPMFNGASSSWNGNTLNIHSNNINPEQYLEVRAVIPLSEFNNATYAKHIDENGYDQIVKVQEDYANKLNTENTAFLVLPIILFVSLVYPVVVYKKYGGSPKTTYTGEYEREIPTKDSPMFVNAMFSTKSDVGTMDNNGIQAAIMEMIDKNIIQLEKDDDDFKLILPKWASFKDQVADKSLTKLQKDVIFLLYYGAEDNVVDMKKMKDKLSNQYTAESFNKTLDETKKEYVNENVDPVLSKYFDNKASSLIRLYCGIAAVCAAILFVATWFFPTIDIPNVTISFWGSLAFIIIAFILYLMPNESTGRWTQEGVDEFSKWKAFERFIKDFSLIKEHPPESVAIWNEYLIYATALGDAKAVIKAMDAIGPVPESSSAYDVYYYGYHDGPAMFSSIISTSSSAAHPDNDFGGGGVDGPGGGSGGGGGGAF